MNHISASAKMEALGALMEQLLIHLEKTDAIEIATTDALIKAAVDDLRDNLGVKDSTRNRAAEYVEHLGVTIQEQRQVVSAGKP